MFNVWENVLAEIQQKVSPANYSTWFQDTSLLVNTADNVVIGVKNSFHVKQLQTKFIDIIKEALQKNGITTNNITFEVKSTTKPKIRPREVTMEPIKTHTDTIKETIATNNNGLNSKYTLDSFVVGSNNDLAFAAARSIIDAPGTRHNPFFLYGGTCLCERVGEDITSLSSLAGIPLIIVKPSRGVSTPECFRAIDSRPLPEFDEQRYAAFISGLNNVDKDPLGRFLEGADLLTNDLELPSMEKVPEIGKAGELLLASGAEFSRMTGSGSAVFAMYKDEKTRDAAYGQIKDDPELSGCEVFVSKTV